MTIPQSVRDALGIRGGAEVGFELDGNGARLVVAPDEVERTLEAMAGAGDVPLTTDEILAFTRR